MPAPQFNTIKEVCREMAPAYRRAYGELERLQVTNDPTEQADAYISELDSFCREKLAETGLPVLGASANASDIPSEGACWLVKTVTGKVNFRRTLERACSQFVYVKNGRPLFAALYFPVEERMVHATAGEGVYAGLRGRPSGRKHLAGGIVRIPNIEPVMLPLEWIEKLATSGVHVRVSGNFSCAMEDIAMGRVDGLLAQGITLPSRALAHLFAKESGLKLTTLDGKAADLSDDAIMVAPLALHSELSNLINSKTKAA